jgi:hypothetical protein
VATLLALVAEKPAFAQAQQFGDRGQLVITAENLVGFSTERFGQDTPNNTERSETYDNFGFLYRGVGTATAHGPWLGGHYFVIPNLSIGATLGFQTAGGSTTSTNGGRTTTVDSRSTFAFMFLPKVGYALMFNNTIGFWFRGGPGFMRAGTTGPDDDDDDGPARSQWFLSVDALFVVTPVQYFGFYVGPQANLSFAGSVSSTTNNTTVSWDATYRSFSIDGGFLGYFDL